MIAGALTIKYTQLAAYLVATYTLSALAMFRFAGSPDEIFAFGAWLWVIPALIALASRNQPTLAGKYRLSVISLVTLAGLAWTTLLVFESTY